MANVTLHIQISIWDEGIVGSVRDLALLEQYVQLLMTISKAPIDAL